MSSLYERLHAEVEQHTHGGDTIEASTLADALLAVVERHQPEMGYSTASGSSARTLPICPACHCPADRCEELPAIAKALGIHT